MEKVWGVTISRDASITAVARGAREEGSLGSGWLGEEGSFKASRRAGRTEDIQPAMRLAGSGWLSSRARWEAEKARRRWRRLTFRTAIRGRIVRKGFSGQSCGTRIRPVWWMKWWK